MAKKTRKSKKTEEKPLKDSILTVNTIIEESRETHIEFSCYVKNYSSMEPLTDYKVLHEIKSHCWEMIICKHPELLLVCLKTGLITKDVFFALIRRSDGEITKSRRARDQGAGVYSAGFKEEVISNPENLLLINDTLILHCAYTARPLEYNIILTQGVQEKSAESIHNSDVIGLCNDLKHLYLNSSFSNFIIEAEGVAFKVHSLILSLHAHYFAELFGNAPYSVPHSTRIDASPEIVHEVLLYIYSGELKDMDFTYMIEVFFMACNWQIRTLVQICIDYFKANFVADNVLDILYGAYSYDVPDLEREVLSFIRNLPHNLKETEKWREIILEVHEISGSKNL